MKTIPLTNSDEVALVDADDYPKVSGYSWYLYKHGSYRAIARTGGPGEPKQIFLHRSIVAVTRRRIAFRDGNYRHNQKSNLRVGPAPRPPKPKKPPRKCLSADDRIESVKIERFREWLYYCKRNGSEGTVERYVRLIRKFITFLNGKSITPVDLTVLDIERFLDHVLQGCGRNTGNNALGTLKSFFTWQTRHYGAPNIGAEVPFLRPEPPKQRVLTDGEYHAVLKVANPLEKDAIQFLSHTGLRRQELIQFTWANVSDDLTFIRFVGKGRKERVVPLSPLVRGILKKSPDRSAPIPFVARYGSSASMMNRLCRLLAERAGIPHFGPHAIRHFFCTRLVKADVSIEKVSKMLGHACLAVTERIYLHLLPEDLLGLTDVLTD